MSTFTYTPSSVPNNNPIDNFVATGTFFEDIYELRINGILIRIVDVPIQSSSITFPSFTLSSSTYPNGPYIVTIVGDNVVTYTTFRPLQVYSTTFTYTPGSITSDTPISNFTATGPFPATNYDLLINGTVVSTSDDTRRGKDSIGFYPFSLDSFQFPSGSYPVTIFGNGNNYTTATQIQVTCFVKGTEILCADGIKKVENIEVNDEVVTYKHGNKKVKHILSFKYTNDKSMSQICKHKEHPLFITGGHSILVDELSEQEKQQTMDIWNELKMVDDKFLLLAFISDKFEKIENENEYDLYHIVLENDELDGQYGIYADNILTETMSINCYNTCLQKQGLMVVNV